MYNHPKKKRVVSGNEQVGGRRRVGGCQSESELVRTQMQNTKVTDRLMMSTEQKHKARTKNQ